MATKKNVNIVNTSFIDREGEEWIWITGFKGTDPDMKCRGLQYEMNKQYSIPEDEKVMKCVNGYHLCKDLGDVFGYYPVGDNNRFFEVLALVRKSDLDTYGERYMDDKLAARSIVFTRELGMDEILTACIEMQYSKIEPDKRPPESKLENWTDEHKRIALTSGMRDAWNAVLTDILVSLGYARPFAHYVIANSGYAAAVAAASQKDLSMDMRAMFIFDSIQNVYTRRRAEDYKSRVRYKNCK